MNLDQLFWLAHLPAGAGWLALLLPIGGWPARRRIALACGALAAGLYVVLFFSDTKAAILASDYSLRGIAAFFDIPRLQLAGWIHYLVVDLVAGIWESDEAERSGMSRWLLIPSLLATMMAGPAGLLLFLACRSWSRRKSATSADPA